MADPVVPSRKEFLIGVLTAIAAGTPAAAAARAELPLWTRASAKPGSASKLQASLTLDDLKVAQKAAALNFKDEELQGILNSVRGALQGYEAVRTQPITYEVEPPFAFKPWGKQPSSKPGVSLKTTPVKSFRTPPSDEDLAFLSVRELGHLLRTRQVTSSALTKISLGRLRQYGDKLLCLVTLLESKAMAAAKRADEELAKGKSRGPLHGVPCGIKDLFATKGDPTTWGSEPHKDQVFDYDAALVEKLEAAGAVIVAKLSLGALAQGDVWFKGRTKNPWNPEQGSSGSSAGSCSATAAGLVPFAIGTETLGSIMSPSHQCRVTGLRPTYGRVSRRGAMAVSWTMDKIGPICRNAEDCALVFSAIQGSDPGDGSAVDMPFHWDPGIRLSNLKGGYVLGQNDAMADTGIVERTEHLKLLSSFGIKLQPIRIAPAPGGVNAVLGVEAAAAFDEFARSDRIDLLKNSAWPNTYRSNRFVPAVEYLQAMRARTLLMRRFEQDLGDLDFLVTTGNGGSTLFITNLTGHPQVLVPFGVDERGRQQSVSLIGRLYDEATLLAVANRLQQAKGFHLLRPDLGKLG